jgi:hypothetical protein
MKPFNQGIALWSGPRNLSTALMYSFANRGDCRIIDEPLFGYFLDKTGAWRPSREEVLKVMSRNPELILADMKDARDCHWVFSKNMANHLEGLDFSLLHDFQNIILTRKPSAVLNSYVKQVEYPTPLDLCYEHQLRILRYLKKARIPFLVVDSDELREDPAGVLAGVCEFLAIPFTRNMLSWPAGARPEDGVWAKYWYGNVHLSSGFMPAKEKEFAIPSGMEQLHEDSLIKFREIISFRNE